MNHLSEPWRARIDELEQRASSLQARHDSISAEYSGLIDIELALELVRSRLDVAIAALSAIADRSHPRAGLEKLNKRARVSARIATNLFHQLLSQCRENQIDLESYASYEVIRASIEQLVLSGGSGMFDESNEETVANEFLYTVISEAIRKYAAPDDEYSPVFELNDDQTQSTLGAALRRLFPMLFNDDSGGPIGIDESEVLTTGTISLPLSQAILFYEEEVLPEVRNTSPERAPDVEAIVTELKGLSIRPGARPMSHPANFHAHGITRFTAAGEPLVPVSLSAAYHTGTNLDRILELVKDEVTRNVAGTGLFPPLDRELDRLRSISSGRSGSRLFPRSRINAQKWFGLLRERYPRIGRIENKRIFASLLKDARRGKRLAGSVRRALSSTGHESRGSRDDEITFLGN